MVIVGSLVLLALMAMTLSLDAPVLRTRSGTLGAGVASGFMNATAGVGGPAIVVYALGTTWSQAGFRATFQFFTIIVSAASVAAKGLPEVSTTTLVLSLTALGLGLAIGEVLSRRVSAERARAMVVAIAGVGACLTLAKGILIW